MYFAVVDIETVNSAATSIATIGIVGVDKCKIVETKEFHIKPEPFIFDEEMTAINGLNQNDFETAPSFSEIWDEISKYFLKYDFCVAHNASFDFGIIRGCCQAYGLKCPEFPVVDTLTYARNSGIITENHQLNTLCEYLGICLDNHHEALADSIATAKLLLKLKEFNKDDILSMFIKSSVNHVSYYKPRTSIHIVKHKDKSNKKSMPKETWIRAKDITAACVECKKDNAFYQKCVVISGELQSYKRADAYAILKGYGADVHDCITKNTNYLITNSKTTTGKIKKAMEYIERGIDIKIIDEEEFLKLLEEGHGTD